MSAGIVDLEAADGGALTPNAAFAGAGLTDEWIRRRSGIASRRWFDEDAELADVAAEACSPVVARSSDPSTIDALLVASTSTRERVPGLAPVVAARAGVPGSALTLDLNAACSGFVYALVCALALCDSGAARSVLLCTVEAMSRVVDRADRQTGFLFADGAAAVLVERRAWFAPSRHLAGSDGTRAGLMREREGGGLHLDGLEVFDRAVRRMTDSAERLAAMDPTPSVLVAHQANGRILEQVRGRVAHLGVPFVNRIETHGNTSSASIPLALAEELGAGSLPAQGRLGAVSYGAGEAWGAVSVGYELTRTR